MSKKLQLTIPTPCHENWDGMTPVEKGKFCGSCQKQVVDFSNVSDRDIAQFFKKPTTGSVCGRFMTDQLDRDIQIPKKRIPWVKYFFQFALPAFLLSIKLSAQTIKGKVKAETVSTDTTRRPDYNDYKTMGMVSRPENFKPFMGDTIVKKITPPVESIKGDVMITTDTVLIPVKEPVCSLEIMGKVSMPYSVIKEDSSSINGKVIDENGYPVPGAFIMIKDTKTGVTTHTDGGFSIKKGNSPVILVASSVGYVTKEWPVDRNSFADPVVIQLKSSERFLVGELVICRVAPVKKESKQTPLMPLITNDNNAASFKVFPNPVLAGSSLNIEWKQLEEGYYSIQLLNQKGQTVYQTEIRKDAKAGTLNMDIPYGAAGSYFLVLTNKKSGKKFSEKIIIQ
ncbi:MAG: carboxypeptidase-like regulatory domain-containing protein [Chitinophagaceae bacterium]